MATKQHIRKEALARRAEISKEEAADKSRVITEKILALPAYKRAKSILLYIDVNGEVKTRELLERAWKDGRRTAVPRCRDKRMDFVEITDYSDLEPGTFGIPEPVSGDPISPGDALMIMPGTAFDRNLSRIGYGGGYYDRYLCENPDIQTVAVSYACQVFDSIPSEEHDVRPRILVTEDEILYRR